MRRMILAVVVVFGFCSVGWGDVIVFKSGGRLTGKVLEVGGGKMKFASVEVGEVTAEIGKIVSISSDEDVELHLAGGEVVKTKLLGSRDGYVRIVSDGREIGLSEVVAINPPGKPAVKWHGDVTAGFSSTHGNTFDESGNVSFNAKRRSEENRVTIAGRYLISRTRDADSGDKTTSEENVTLSGKYDRFWTEKFYSYVNGSFKKDHIADLDRRLIGGVGLGYQWAEGEELSFSTDLGVSELCEQYTSKDATTGASIRTKNDEVSVRAGYILDWKINGKLTLLHKMDYYPSMADVADYFLTTDAELRLALTESLFASVKTIFDYDSTPAEGNTSTDTKYILGVGWKY